MTYMLNGNDGIRAFSWNARNQLAAIGTTTFQYDGIGRRSGKRSFTIGAPLLSSNGRNAPKPGQQRSATVISPGGSVAIPGLPMVATKAPLLT